MAGKGSLFLSQHAYLVETEAPHVATLVGLHESVLASVERGEPAFAIDPGVDADASLQDAGQAILLGRVAADQCFAGEMRMGVIKPPPEQPVITLIRHGQHGVHIGMGKDMGAGGMPAAEPLTPYSMKSQITLEIMEEPLNERTDGYAEIHQVLCF